MIHFTARKPPFFGSFSHGSYYWWETRKIVIDYQSVLQIEGSGKHGIYAGNRDHSGWSVNIVRLILAVDVSSILLVQGSKRGSYRDSLSLMRIAKSWKCSAQLVTRAYHFSSWPQVLHVSRSPWIFDFMLFELDCTSLLHSALSSSASMLFNAVSMFVLCQQTLHLHFII